MDFQCSRVFKMTNVVDPDQTAPEKQSDLGLHLLDQLVFILRFLRYTTF